MHKIETSLLLKKHKNDLLIINVLDQFYKESNMLINNFFITYKKMAKIAEFPHKKNLYDVSWYKNLLISSNIILDRLNYEIHDEKDYEKIFDNQSSSDFVAFCKNWNKINEIVKANLEPDVWIEKRAKWNLKQTAIRLNEIISCKLNFNAALLKSISTDINEYRDSKSPNVESVHPTLDEVSTAAKTAAATAAASASSKLDPRIADNFNRLKGSLAEEQKAKQATKFAAPSSIDAAEKQLLNNLDAFDKQDPAPQPFVVPKTETTIASSTPVPPPPPVPTTSTEIPQTDVPFIAPEVKTQRTKGPISPVKREMDTVLRWIKTKEDEIKEYRSLTRMKYNPLELKGLLVDIDRIDTLLKQYSSEINSSSRKLPISPEKNKMDQIIEWVGTKESEVREYRRLTNLKYNPLELKGLVQDIDATSALLREYEKAISSSKNRIPVSSEKNAMDKILAWVSEKEAEIREYKRLAKGYSDGQKLLFLQKDIARVEAELEATIQEINRSKKALPINPYTNELNNIIKWIASRDEAIKDYKKEINRIKKEQELIEVSNDLQKVIEEYNHTTDQISVLTNKHPDGKIITRPVDKQTLKEVNHVLKWISTKEEQIVELNKKIKKEKLLAEKAKMQQTLDVLNLITKDITRVRTEITKTKNEIAKAAKVDKQIAAEYKKFEEEMINKSFDKKTTEPKFPGFDQLQKVDKKKTFAPPPPAPSFKLAPKSHNEIKPEVIKPKKSFDNIPLPPPPPPITDFKHNVSKTPTKPFMDSPVHKKEYSVKEVNDLIVTKKPRSSFNEHKDHIKTDIAILVSSDAKKRAEIWEANAGWNKKSPKCSICRNKKNNNYTILTLKNKHICEDCWVQSDKSTSAPKALNDVKKTQDFSTPPPLKQQKPIAFENQSDDAKLNKLIVQKQKKEADILKLYKTELDILKTALETLPEYEDDISNDKLPIMINRLIEKGYLEDKTLIAKKAKAKKKTTAKKPVKASSKKPTPIATSKKVATKNSAKKKLKN